MPHRTENRHPTLDRRQALAGFAALAAAGPAWAREAVPSVRFASIDGGEYRMEAWRGRPVLVVNTASLCGFTPQYEGLQALWERYRDAGLIVLAVPSNDFRQELASEAEVKDFCEVTFGLDLPMTEITSVRGPKAHPFYAWMARAQGWEPAWNFNKVLIAPDGSVAGTWGSATRPEAPAIRRAVERALGRG